MCSLQPGCAPMTTPRVVIVGAGPVGLALSVALARYGVSSVIIEQRSEPTSPDESRAIVWMPKGIEFLEWIGLRDAFAKHAVVRTVHRFRIRGRKLIDLNLQWARSPYPYSLNLPQYFSETLFEEEARRHPALIDIKRGCEVTGIRDEGSSVTVMCKHLRTGDAEEVRGAYIVGCDGAKSRTRELAGIALHWQDYGTMSAVADIEAKLSDDPAMSWIELNPRRPTGLFCFHPDRWRIIYRLNQGETREKGASPEFVDAVLRAHFPFIKDYRLLWSSCFRLGQGQSDVYHRGRIVLAGDAAHPMGPSAGAGMMVGMLGVWRLAFRLHRILNETDAVRMSAVLQEYQDEQKKGARMIQKANAATFAQIAITNVFLGVVRNIVLKLISFLPFIAKKMVVADTLTDQEVIAPSAQDELQARVNFQR
jgi:2-polyprenyl-6-methoxyphenol hydroxylase-like FAD-dependent oxidoreductase